MAAMSTATLRANPDYLDGLISMYIPRWHLNMPGCAASECPQDRGKSSIPRNLSGNGEFIERIARETSRPAIRTSGTGRQRAYGGLFRKSVIKREVRGVVNLTKSRKVEFHALPEGLEANFEIAIPPLRERSSANGACA